MFKEKSKTYSIDNGIPCDKFSYSELDRKEIRNKLAVDDNCYIIGQIGRISPEKNQLFSIKAFEEFKRKTNADAKLVLVGKEMYSNPSEYVSKSEFKNDIMFLGPVYSNIEKYYSAFDCCLLPSKHEGMSLSLLECCSNGVASIFSIAVPKLKIDCPQTKYLPLDIEKWSNCIIENSKDKTNNRVNNLLGTVYDIRVCAKSYIDLYYNYDSIVNNVDKGNKQ